MKHRVLLITFFASLLLTFAGCANLSGDYDDNSKPPYDPNSAPPVGYFIIQNNDDYTYNQEVTLSANCRYVTQMRYRSGAGDWSDWETYSPKKKWILERGSGTKRIQAEFRNERFPALECSDEIYLVNRVVSPSPEEGSSFGCAIAVSDDGQTIAAGNDLDDVVRNGFPNSNQGSVNVLRYADGKWNGERMVSSNGQADDWFGHAVSISGDGSIIAVGAPGCTIGSGKAMGMVYVFEYDGSWNETRIADYTGGAEDLFGASVSLSSDGRLLAVGVPGLNGIADRVKLYRRASAGSWSLVKTFSLSGVTDVRYGFSVALNADGSRLAVGAPYMQRTIGVTVYYECGSAYVYTANGTAWTEETFMQALPENHLYYGWSVALSDDGMTFAAGAYGKTVGLNTNQGMVFVYRNGGSSWTGSTLTNGGAAQDCFGYSLALSADGSRLAAGAIGSDSARINAGAVAGFVWDALTGSYSMEPLYTAYEASAEDQFGYFVTLTADGATMIVGSFKDDDTLTDQGSFYIYE